MIAYGLYSFLTPKILVKFQWHHLQRGHRIHVGWKNLRLSTNNSLYLEDGRRQTQSFFMKDDRKDTCALSNGDIADNLE